jgi:hypothetical protein
MAQMIEYVPTKNKDLSSISNTAFHLKKTERRMWKREEIYSFPPLQTNGSSFL